MADYSPTLRVDAERRDEVSFLKVTGVLDAFTYRSLRDAIIKAALDEPRAVIVDVDDLSVPSESAWSVFTSVRWHVSRWPDVPILLVCADAERRQVITRCGVTRYVPTHEAHDSALDAVAEPSEYRRRERSQLAASPASMRRARALVSNWLTAWAQEDLIPVACTVATIFVENVLAHTESAPVLIVESLQDFVTVAVEDGSTHPASLHEDADHGAEIVSGLGIVAALCRAWGSTPTSSGKTVWALVARENQI